MLINFSERTVNYNVMHHNILHYTAEYIATHCSLENKTRPYNIAGYVIRLLSIEHIAAKSTGENKHTCRKM